MVLPNPIRTLDQAGLEAFQTGLIRRGFEPRDPDRRIWVGPIVESLKSLADAEEITIHFVDGWPFEHPRLLVPGIDLRHVGPTGEVCLWRPGEASDASIATDGYFARVEEWVERTHKGFRQEDFALDAHLSFGDVQRDAIATVELSSLGMGTAGSLGNISATWNESRTVLDVQSGNPGSIEGRWYLLANVPTPPRGLAALRDVLAANQRNNFDRRLNAISKGKPQVFLFAWDRDFGRDALILHAEHEAGGVVTRAVEVAPTDLSVLRMRAGPDWELLAPKAALVFGVGSIGSNLSLRLAECGLGRLVIVDGQRLRPGDIVRHAASRWAVGNRKTDSTGYLIRTRAPWTKVEAVDGAIWNPELLRGAVRDHDLVIDATGVTGFVSQLSLLCDEVKMPLLSVALYREGSLVRVCRQGLASDTVIADRLHDERYPIIAAGDEAERFEAGCSSAVNNASPVAVAAAAALAAEVGIDLLTGRSLYPDEVIDVYRPLDAAPFDQIGRVGR